MFLYNKTKYRVELVTKHVINNILNPDGEWKSERVSWLHIVFANFAVYNNITMIFPLSALMQIIYWVCFECTEAPEYSIALTTATTSKLLIISNCSRLCLYTACTLHITIQSICQINYATLTYIFSSNILMYVFIKKNIG